MVDTLGSVYNTFDGVGTPDNDNNNDHNNKNNHVNNNNRQWLMLRSNTDGLLRRIGPRSDAGSEVRQRPASDSPYGRSRAERVGASQTGAGSPGSDAWNAVGQEFAIGPSVLALSYVERLDLTGS